MYVYFLYVSPLSSCSVIHVASYLFYFQCFTTPLILILILMKEQWFKLSLSDTSYLALCVAMFPTLLLVYNYVWLCIIIVIVTDKLNKL